VSAGGFAGNSSRGRARLRVESILLTKRLTITGPNVAGLPRSGPVPPRRNTHLGGRALDLLLDPPRMNVV